MEYEQLELFPVLPEHLREQANDRLKRGPINVTTYSCKSTQGTQLERVLSILHNYQGSAHYSA